MVDFIVYLVVLALSLIAMFFIVKAAVAEGIKEAMWNLEVSMKSAVKNGTLEALQELEKSKKSKSETENDNG
ncbi:hypothetical protein [Acutalibacter muris]|uniref:hypothetical protein n=1 Tax=Acutalibacter muris TaxID=1796620 RepID=UPI00272C1B5B|nr:hypothetical protein [Acutalibacter muris]